MHNISAELHLYLQALETDRHVRHHDRRLIAEARRRAEQDRRELERAWQALNKAIEAESRSSRELVALTH
ncbi:hypothetical protein [Rhodococcoides yunnanense]|uniref:hypothetical protein n=1 Tax=Rhodococcoides yunnanense TaxID=278209 RepID=UPI001114F8EA|nr:hypothetical protein [Rhodococcus yunnanensis]